MSTSASQISRLHDVANRLVKTLLAKAAGNKSFFVNEIPADLQVTKDPQVIFSVLSGLLSTVVNYAKDSCIRLSAKMYGNVILVHVKNSNGFNRSSIQGQLQQLQLLADKTRGSVGYTHHRNNITSITFGFSSSPF